MFNSEPSSAFGGAAGCGGSTCVCVCVAADPPPQRAPSVAPMFVDIGAWRAISASGPHFLRTSVLPDIARREEPEFCYPQRRAAVRVSDHMKGWTTIMECGCATLASPRAWSMTSSVAARASPPHPYPCPASTHERPDTPDFCSTRSETKPRDILEVRVDVLSAVGPKHAAFGPNKVELSSSFRGLRSQPAEFGSNWARFGPKYRPDFDQSTNFGRG